MSKKIEARGLEADIGLEEIKKQYDQDMARRADLQHQVAQMLNELDEVGEDLDSDNIPVDTSLDNLDEIEAKMALIQGKLDQGREADEKLQEFAKLFLSPEFDQLTASVGLEAAVQQLLHAHESGQDTLTGLPGELPEADDDDGKVGEDHKHEYQPPSEDPSEIRVDPNVLEQKGEPVQWMPQDQGVIPISQSPHIILAAPTSGARRNPAAPGFTCPSLKCPTFKCDIL